MGSWSVKTVDGADVRLRSGRIGIVTVDVTAPVTSGQLHVADDGVRLSLVLALDQLRTRNFLWERAARALVKRHEAHALTYAGAGPAQSSPWQIVGHARSGDIDLELLLTATPSGPSHDPLSEIELMGSAAVGTVHLPFPGLGTVDDFSFDVDARLAMRPH